MAVETAPLDGQAAATAAAHGGESAGAFPPFDPSLFASQLVWFALCFIALYWLMSSVALPKVAAVIAVREGTLKADRDGAVASTASAEQAKIAMEQAIAKARADARTLVDDMRAKTQADLSAEQEAAEARVSARVAEAEAKVNAARDKALSEVGGEAQKLAADIVAKFAGAA